LHSVTHQEGVGFVVAGSSGFLAHSPDGISWEVVSAEAPIAWESVTSGSGASVVVGGDVLGVSGDGGKWRFADWDPAPRGSGIPIVYPDADFYDPVVGPEGATLVGRAGFSGLLPLPPVIRQHSENLTVELDAEVYLSAEPGGTGPFTYQW